MAQPSCLLPLPPCTFLLPAGDLQCEVRTCAVLHVLICCKCVQNAAFTMHFFECHARQIVHSSILSKQLLACDFTVGLSSFSVHVTEQFVNNTFTLPWVSYTV